MWKNFALALICSLVSAVAFFEAGAYSASESSPFAVLTLLGVGFLFFSFFIKNVIKDYIKRNPKEAVPTELDPNGAYELYGVLETRSAGDKCFFLHLYDLKRKEEVIFRAPSQIPSGFKEVKTVSGNFLIPASEELMFYLLRAGGMRA